MPFVKDFAYANLTWDDYDRASNVFKFSYSLIKIWDDGQKETVEPRINASVLGTEKYPITASDKTHYKGAVETIFVVTPPVKVRDFSVSNDSFTNYDKTNNGYDLSFTLHSDLSNGTSKDEVITVKVGAGKVYEYTAVDNSLPGAPYSETFKFTAPAAPVPPVLTVKDTSVTITNQEELANNEDKNNYKVTYDLTVTLSDNKIYTFNNLVITIPYNPGNNTGSKTVTEDHVVNGITYTVTYTVTVKVNVNPTTQQ